MDMRKAFTEAAINVSIYRQDAEHPVKAYVIKSVCVDDRSDWMTFVCFDDESRDKRLRWIEERNKALEDALGYRYEVKVIEENKYSRAHYEHMQELLPGRYIV